MIVSIINSNNMLNAYLGSIYMFTVFWLIGKSVALIQKVVIGDILVQFINWI